MPGERDPAKPDVRQPSEHHPLIHAWLPRRIPEAATSEEGPDERYASLFISHNDEERGLVRGQVPCASDK